MKGVIDIGNLKLCDKCGWGLCYNPTLGGYECRYCGLIDKMRSMTSEEREAYQKYLYALLEPTGICYDEELKCFISENKDRIYETARKNTKLNQKGMPTMPRDEREDRDGLEVDSQA